MHDRLGSVRGSDSEGRKRRRRRRFFAGASIFLFVCGGCTPLESAPVTRPDVLLITIDTLRADYLGAWGQSLPTSPTIDALAAQGVRFEDATVQWPKTWPSIASLLTGRYPHSTGLQLKRRRIREEHVLLAEIFQASGYRTGAVVANFNVGQKFGFDQGFEAFVESWQEGFESEQPGARFVNRAGRVKRYTNATLVTEQAVSWLSQLDGTAPFFLWIHYMDPHGPYRPPDAYEARFAEAFPPERVDPSVIPPYQRWRDPTTGEVVSDLADYRTRYAGEIRYLDDEIARLLESVDRLRKERTPPVIALTADHGESISEQGYYLEHGRLPYQSTAHVPLLVVHEGRIPAGQVFEVPVGVIDLSPTLLDLAGIPVPQEFEGQSLRPMIETGNPDHGPRHVFMEAGNDEQTQLVIRSGRWKLVHARSPGDRLAMKGREFELYDLRSDPHEAFDLSATYPRVVERLAEKLSEWSAVAVSSAESRPVELEELAGHEREMLRALGYLE